MSISKASTDLIMKAVVDMKGATAFVFEYKKEADRVLLSRGKSGFTIKRGQLNTDESIEQMFDSGKFKLVASDGEG